MTLSRFLYDGFATMSVRTYVHSLYWYVWSGFIRNYLYAPINVSPHYPPPPGMGRANMGDLTIPGTPDQIPPTG